MTRLEQALDWMGNRRNDGAPLPTRHLHVLDKADALVRVDDRGCVILSPRGLKLLRKRPGGKALAEQYLADHYDARKNL